MTRLAETLPPDPTETAADPRARRGRVRLRDWDRVTRGAYAVRDRTLVDELRAWSLVLPPTAAFTHLTAAECLGWWLPAPIDHPVFVACSLGDNPRRPGLLACRHPEPGPHRLVDGLRVSTPGETLLACACDLGLLDLAIMADSALRLGHCTLTDLALAAARRRRGAPLLRRVLPLLDQRSESAWESVMRVLHQAAEIPVVPQRTLYDGNGLFVARADLWVVGTRRIHEYDGAVHRLTEVHRSDLHRERRLTRAGWFRHGFSSGDLLDNGADIIADTDRLLGRTWDPRRLSAWNELVSSSMYGARGRARARRNWRRRTEREPDRALSAGVSVKQLHSF